MIGELKKILLSPMPYLLFVGCLAMNLWVILNYRGQKELVAVSAGMAEEQNGLYVVEETIEELYQPFASFDAEGESRKGIPPVKNMFLGAVKLTDSLDYRYLAKIFTSGMKLSGAAQEYAYREYGRLQKVIEKNHENGTDAAFFVPCSEDFFSLYSKMLPLFLTVQSILAAVLMMIRLADDPFSSHIESLVYTSLHGRKINRRKLLAGLAAGIIFTLFLWGATILAANGMLPLGRLWGTPIGSMMVLEDFSPVISWSLLSVAEFVLCQMAVCIAVAVLFMFAAFILALHLKNGFFAFMVQGFICACIYALTSLMPRTTELYFILQHNLVDLARKAGHWFVSGSAFLAPRGYEITTLIFWMAVLAMFTMLKLKQFEREDI